MIRGAVPILLLIFGWFGGHTVCAGEAAKPQAFYWRSLPVGKDRGQAPTAVLLTLFRSSYGLGSVAGQDIPLVSVLRDTLGDNDPTNDRLMAVWLLSYSHPTLAQKAESAVPFFYWRLGNGSATVGKKDTAPLLDLSAPDHPAASNVERQLLQWTALDTIDAPLRATSREYRTNETDHERIHLEEATTFLMQAPVTGGPDALSEEERNSVVARLQLRKSLLGGFVSADKVASLGKQAIYQQEEVRSRNWELLRQCAEKTGLFFEPVNLGRQDDDQSQGEYAMLWFPAGAANEPGGIDLRPIWKLLDVSDPYHDDRLGNWDGISERRAEKTLIPLGIYNLNYPGVPLLMIDFRDGHKLRRHEVLQQTINELTAGIIGLSHFANWYYFIGADFYNFYQARHGSATKHADRLDCYSQFRAALSLDNRLDPKLREEMKRHVDSVSINPLAASEEREMTAALHRYSWLQVQAAGDDNRMMKRLDNQRREELAEFGETPKRQVSDEVFHSLTLGRYNHRVKAGEEDLALLDIYRRVNYQLAFLDGMVKAGTAPEVSYQQADIERAVSNLADLMPVIKADGVRAHVQNTLNRLGELSSDEALRADCAHALATVRRGVEVRAQGVPGVVAAPAVLEDLQ